MRKNYTVKLLAALFLLLLTVTAAAQTHTVYGTVSYHNDGIRVLEGVTIELRDGNNLLVASTTSNNNGYYEFTNLPNGNYTLSGSYNAEPGGVNVISAIMVLHHIIGIAPLQGMSLLAADVNGDGLITMSDYFLILLGNLIFGNPFPAGEWVFEELTFTLDGLKSSNEKSAGGSSVGDVAGGFDPQPSQSPVHFTSKEELFFSDPGTELTIAIKAGEQMSLSGMHMAIDYPAHLVEIISIESTLSFLDYDITGNSIILSSVEETGGFVNLGMNDELISMRVRLSDNLSDNELIRFTLDEKSHFVDNNLELPFSKLTTPAITSKHFTTASLSNYPNPFSYQTSITYNLENTQQVNLMIFSMDGRMIRSLVNEVQQKGVHTIDFKRNNLEPGMYLLNLQLPESMQHKETRVMIITSD